MKNWENFLLVIFLREEVGLQILRWYIFIESNVIRRLEIQQEGMHVC
jgi:hypothetical protein